MLADVREALSEYLEDDFLLLSGDGVLLAANADVGFDQVHPPELVDQLQQ